MWAEIRRGGAGPKSVSSLVVVFPSSLGKAKVRPGRPAYSPGEKPQRIRAGCIHFAETRRLTVLAAGGPPWVCGIFTVFQPEAAIPGNGFVKRDKNQIDVFGWRPILSTT